MDDRGIDVYSQYLRRTNPSGSGPSDGWTIVIGIFFLIVLIVAGVYDIGLLGVFNKMLGKSPAGLLGIAFGIVVGLCWLKLCFRAIFGLVEIFFAGLILLEFANNPGRHPDDSLYFYLNWLAGYFAPVFFCVQGVENVAKGVLAGGNPQKVSANSATDETVDEVG